MPPSQKGRTVAASPASETDFCLFGQVVTGLMVARGATIWQRDPDPVVLGAHFVVFRTAACAAPSPGTNLC